MANITNSTGRQLASAAGRGDMKALRDLADALVIGQGYAEYAGSPVSNLIPQSIGQRCFDTSNLDWYVATGVTSANWAPMAFPDLSAAELNYLDGITAGVALASKAVILDSSANFQNRIGHIESGRGRFEVFDDMFTATFDVTNNWISFVGSAGTLATHVDNPEGKVSLTSGAAGGADDGVVVSSRVLANGALVSDGLIVFETRVAMDVITGANFCAGLSDKICTSAERNLYKVNSGTIADGGLSLANAVCLAYDTDATASTKWQFCSEIAGSIAGSAAESAHSTGPVVDTYAVIRIEVDATGDARTYLDGALINTQALAVATTSVLVPFIGINTADDANTATVVDVDYIYFSGARPASDA